MVPTEDGEELELWGLERRAARAPGAPGAPAPTADTPPGTAPPPGAPPPAATAALAAHPLTAAPPGRVVLRGDVAIGLVGADAREVATIARHVAPDRAAALARVADAARAAWRDELRAAYFQRIALGPARVARRLAAAARAAAAAEPALRGARVGEDGALALPHDEPLVGRDVVAPWRELVLALDPDGAARLPTGGTGIALPLDAGELAEIGRLLGLLAGGAGPGEVGAYARASLAARTAWGRIVALDLLAPAPAVPPLAGLPRDHLVSLGFHGLLVDLAGDRVLIDPVLAAGAGVRTPGAADLPPLAAVILTSVAADRLDVPTLLALDKRAPIYLPPEVMAPRAARLCEDLGFADVRTASPGVPISLGGGGHVIPLALGDELGVLVVGGRGAALCAAGVAQDGATQLALVATLHELAARLGAISPLLLDDRPARARCDRGWAWLVEPAARWTAPVPDAPLGLETLARAARAELVIAPVGPEVTGPALRTPVRPPALGRPVPIGTSSA